MKRVIAIFLSVVIITNIFGFYTAFADEKLRPCSGINRLSMKNGDFYEGYSSAKLLAENKDISINEETSLLMLGSINIKEGITSEIDDESITGTGSGKQLVTRKMLYLPFGSAFVFDTNDMYDADGNKITNLDLRIYEYDENGIYSGEVNQSYLCPDGNADNDASNFSFTVSKKEGMYVQLRFIPWEKTFDKNTVTDFEKRLNVYDLTAIDAPVFDNETISICWENDDKYEAWATKTIFYNEANDLYYWFYASQPTHTEYSGNIYYRTSSDLSNWSEKVFVCSKDTFGFNVTMDGALQTADGDIIISLMCRSNGSDDTAFDSRILRSSDNGKTWKLQNLILDGQDVTGIYRIQRPRILNDGRIFSCCFDKNKKERCFVIFSEDGGNTFVSTDFNSSFPLVNNGEYDFAKLKNGNIVCVERTSKGLAVSISTDNGKSFKCEKSVNGLGVGAPFIYYDEKTDNLVIYEIDRYATGALVGIYTSGDKISSFIIDDEPFSGFRVNTCYLGLNVNIDEGYPHIIKDKNGNIKCFYYYASNDGVNKASLYSVDSIKDSKRQHMILWQNKNGFIVKSCTECNEELLKLQFDDLSEYVLYGDYVEYTSVNNKFIAGTNPPYYTEFSPRTAITRAMFVAILYRMAGEPYKNANAYKFSPFSDIKDTSVYYYDAACWALDNGITNQTTFKPNDNVTREQTASFLFRYAQNNGTVGSSDYKKVNLSSYPDYNSVHDWAVEPLQWANYNNMITGTSQGYINPQGATQRIHASRILYGFGKVCNIGCFE